MAEMQAKIIGCKWQKNINLIIIYYQFRILFTAAELLANLQNEFKVYFSSSISLWCNGVCCVFSQQPSTATHQRVGVWMLCASDEYFFFNKLEARKKIKLHHMKCQMSPKLKKERLIVDDVKLISKSITFHIHVVLSLRIFHNTLKMCAIILFIAMTINFQSAVCKLPHNLRLLAHMS